MSRDVPSTRSTLDRDPGPEFWSGVLESCGSFNLRRASRAVTQFYDDILRPTGLRSTQMVLLVALGAEGEISVGRMAREIGMSPSSLSRMLSVLEREGLVESSRADKGRRLLCLTAAGEKALRDAVPYWQQAQDRFIAQLGKSHWARLSAQLSRAVTATRR